MTSWLLIVNWISNLALAASPAKAPLFTDVQIDGFEQKVKASGKLPEHAVDILFDFYKKNRASSGGLKDVSCIDKKDYRIRDKDPRMTKAYLKNGIENENCLCLIDYTASKETERGHCIFLSNDGDPKIENFLTAHGRGSDEKNGRPTKFTNSLTSTGTTLSGLFLTAQDTYGFGGHMVGVGKYSSMGLTLYGVEDSNWTAARVGKATHGAPYVHGGPKKNVGRSLGCPAMPIEQAKAMLPRCTGKAAWLNYTYEVQKRTVLSPQTCK